MYDSNSFFCCMQELALAEKNLEESKTQALEAIQVANSRKDKEQQAAEIARQAKAARDKFLQGETRKHARAVKVKKYVGVIVCV